VKKLHKLLIIIGVVLVATVLGYQLIVARVSTEIFDAMKYRTFQLGMSSTRAKSLFSAYGEIVKMSTEKEDYGVTTTLTFEGKKSSRVGIRDEKLTLYFLNDQLDAFHYHNALIGFEQR